MVVQNWFFSLVLDLDSTYSVHLLQPNPYDLICNIIVTEKPLIFEVILEAWTAGEIVKNLFSYLEIFDIFEVQVFYFED